ncbi:MAG: NAD(P)H-dependent oxidoreductase subunit E [Deltaproteobacteria bacterium]|nr:NAD(P)H-dependent oxidoreductase subunit E [Deltaproteobacteria bacterium]
MSAETLSLEVAALYDNNPANLIAMLQEIQRRNKNRFLSREALETLAGHLALPVAKVYRIATFFKAFNLEPKGEHMVSLCVGTACHVRGAARVLAAFEGELGIVDGGTTGDFKFSIETVNCVGACALGPVAVIDEDYYGELDADKVPELLSRFR